MNLTRDSFTPESLLVMDQVARLIYLSDIAMGLIGTFTNHGKTGASEHMREIVHFSGTVSTGLMGALFHTEKKRSIELNKTYKAARDGVVRILTFAKVLQVIEEECTCGAGNSISNGVIPNLEILGEQWNAMS